jgi:hypothetical protein
VTELGSVVVFFWSRAVPIRLVCAQTIHSYWKMRHLPSARFVREVGQDVL